MNTYEGWANYETWNVSLWINNTENLYKSAVSFMKNYKGDAAYRDFLTFADLTGKTPDDVNYSSAELNYLELNQMLKELNS